MTKKIKLEIVQQSQTVLVQGIEPEDYDILYPESYLLLRDPNVARGEFGNEFWASLSGEDALRIYEEGQKVEVELRFYVTGFLKEHDQKVQIRRIKLIND